MFSLARFLLGGGALASSSGLASYLVPYFFDGGTNSIFQETSSNTLDLERLRESIEKVKKELQDWVTKFEKSKSVSQQAKNKEFDTSMRLMTIIQTNEDGLKALYEVIQQKLQTLEAKSKEWSTAVKKKLNIQSNLSQLKNVLSNLSSLISTLHSWEQNVSQVIRAFEHKSSESQASTSGGGTQETAGSKAEKALEEAKQQFEVLRNSISSARKSVSHQQLQVLDNDWTNYFDYLSTNVKITWLEQHMQLLNRTVNKTNEDASKTANEINKNNELLRKSHSEYNKFKGMETSFHKFSEEFKSKLKSIELN